MSRLRYSDEKDYLIKCYLNQKDSTDGLSEIDYYTDKKNKLMGYLNLVDTELDIEPKVQVLNILRQKLKVVASRTITQQLKYEGIYYYNGSIVFNQNNNGFPEILHEDIDEVENYCNGKYANNRIKNIVDQYGILQLKKNRESKLDFELKIRVCNDLISECELKDSTIETGNRYDSLDAGVKEFLLDQIIKQSETFQGLSKVKRAKLFEVFIKLSPNTMREKFPLNRNNFSLEELNDSEKNHYNSALQLWSSITGL